MCAGVVVAGIAVVAGSFVGGTASVVDVAVRKRIVLAGVVCTGTVVGADVVFG